VEFSPRGFGLLCLVFELVVGTLILSKGRAVKLGLLAGIVFLLGITPLKYTQANPIMAAGLAYLLTRDFTQSLPDLLRDRLEQRQPPRELA
jgi:chromate transport protein ChrA